MTRDEKIKAILEAVRSKKASANEIEPSRKGATISRLKAGKPVKDETVDKLYASLQAVLKKKGASSEVSTTESITLENKEDASEVEKKSEASINESITLENKSITESINESITLEREPEKIMSERIAVLEKENQELRGIVEGLKNQVESITDKLNSITIQKESTEPITKSITLQSTGIEKHESMNCLGFSISKDREGRFYGVRRIGGKLKSVYIGRDLGKAQEKIEAYLAKHQN